MSQNKEQLNKLLGFIKRLIDEPGNEDFTNELRKMLGEKRPSTSVTNPQLADIEKYLGLDYLLDSASPFIDYTFVDDGYIRNQLVSDFREMLRYRYGVRSHKIDFSEFCRYAILQAEQMLNYFYQKKFSTNEELLKFITENVEWAKIEKVEKIASLSFAIKLSAFFNQSGSKKNRVILDFAREVRNAQSHRGNEKSYKKIAYYRSQLNKLGFPLSKDGEVYLKNFKDDKDLKEKYESLDKAEYWNYRFLLWKEREPFDEVIDALKATAQHIKESIKNK